MAIPTIIARVAAGGAITAAEDSEASLMSALAERLGIPFNPEQGELSIPVASSAIAEIGFRVPDTITVVFKRGGSQSYDFPGSIEEFAAFALSPSKGGFFNAHFRGR
jgi:hypothetical protein